MSARLYTADREQRIQQEFILGIGGVRVLRTLGINPAVWHANEGHTSFMMLERVREEVARGMNFTQAVERVRATTVFTTHTPVLAGNGVFSKDLVEKYFHNYRESLGLSQSEFLLLGQMHSGETTFNMTVLGMKLAERCNGVSRLHGEVTRRMWHGLWPDLAEDKVPITHITNGVHLPSWIAPEVYKLGQKFLAPDLIDRHDEAELCEKVLEIPAKDKTAKNGTWVSGPGIEYFEIIKREFGGLPVIAEDLGVVTPEVEALRDRLGLPGMRVLQFAFSGNPKQNVHLPHFHVPNCVVYTGTHDNITALGWFHGEDIGETTQTIEERKAETQRALAYLGSDGREVNWDFIRLAMTSVADTAVIPLQDVLGLGNEARMNKPSVDAGNWVWRFSAGALTDEIREKLKKITHIVGR